MEKVPVVAVVGRPNVGKSTLVNRILGSRQAVVEDTPGVTRDRVAYDAIWRGRAFTLVDTGGWEPSTEGGENLAARVTGQARVAVDAADAVVFVVDATVGVTDADAAVAGILRRSGKPVVVAANKVDDAKGESDVAALWSLGLGEPAPVSALHGRGSGDLLDLILDALPDAPKETEEEEGGPRRVALLGRPNVGKSSLLNKLVGHQRALVDAAAGTTRDPVDELVELGGTTWRFVDTAGIRRRFRENQGADYYAALRTAGALDRAEVAVVLIDASEPLTDQDLRIVTMVIEAGRALVIAYNKWDMVDEERRRYLDREIDRQLHFARWAPRVNISALTGRHMDRLVPALETALAGWETRVPTGRLNAWLTGLVAATPPPVRGGRQPKILFATQAGIRPPTFVLFASGFLEAAYRRFVERRLREEFGFEGSPVQVSVRVRAKRETPGGRRPLRSSRRRLSRSVHECVGRRGGGWAGVRVGDRARARGEPGELVAGQHAPRHRIPGRQPGERLYRERVGARRQHEVAEPAAAQHRRVGDQARVREGRQDRRDLRAGVRERRPVGHVAREDPGAAQRAPDGRRELRRGEVGRRAPSGEHVRDHHVEGARGQRLEHLPGVADANPDRPAPPERQPGPHQVHQRGVDLDRQLPRTRPGRRHVPGQRQRPRAEVQHVERLPGRRGRVDHVGQPPDVLEVEVPGVVQVDVRLRDAVDQQHPRRPPVRIAQELGVPVDGVHGVDRGLGPSLSGRSGHGCQYR
jgi:GTPase